MLAVFLPSAGRASPRRHRRAQLMSEVFLRAKNRKAGALEIVGFEGRGDILVRGGPPQPQIADVRASKTCKKRLQKKVHHQTAIGQSSS